MLAVIIVASIFVLLFASRLEVYRKAYLKERRRRIELEQVLEELEERFNRLNAAEDELLLLDIEEKYYDEED